MSKIIFFGNQKLVQGIKPDITPITDTLTAAGHNLIATIKTREDLATVPSILAAHPGAIAVLASFGFIVPASIIQLFEPRGILNIHPSLLPKYRGPTPIETAIKNGEEETGISIMKIAKEMDSGDVYAQKTLKITPDDDKFTLAQKLTQLGADTLIEVIAKNPAPAPQTGTPIYTQKLDKTMSPLRPDLKTAEELSREIRAFLGFPKSKYTIHDINCTILKAHPAPSPLSPIDLKCQDNTFLCIDQLLPENSRPMSPTAFLNGLR